MIVDQFSDAAFGTLVKITNEMPTLEAFVKTANIEPSEAAALPDSAFADPDNRKFPVHTAVHAALSCAYSKLASDLPAPVANNIKVACEVFGLKDELFAVTKTAEAVFNSGDYLLPDLKLLSVKTANEVKRAQVELLGALPKLDLEHRATACANLVKRADEFKVALHPEVQKLAGFVLSSTADLRNWIEARANIAPTFKTAYQKLADGLKGQPSEIADRTGLLKVANAIAVLDEKSGIDKHYDRKLPDPLRTVFNSCCVATNRHSGVGMPASLINFFDRCLSRHTARHSGSEPI